MRRRWCGDWGAAPATVAVLVGGVALALMLVVVPAEVRVRMAKAQWAADGAARAAAAEVVAGTPDGGVAARRLAIEVAEANGARVVAVELVDWSSTGPGSGTSRVFAVSPTVMVTVELDGVEARAGAARFSAPTP